MIASIDDESKKTAQTAPMVIDADDTGTHRRKTESVIADDTVTGTHMMIGNGHLGDGEAGAHPALALIREGAHKAHRPHKLFNDPNALSPPKQRRTVHPTFPSEGKRPPPRPQRRKSPTLGLPVV